MSAAVWLIAAVTLERLAELWLARRNTARLIARGAYEVAPDHYPLIVAMHALWLGALWVFGWSSEVQPVWLAVFALLQLLRFWVLGSLGSRWTTRILILPGATLVAKGPYRFVSHPNYLVVVGEILVLPLCLGLPWVALIFTILNAAVLAIRIRAENLGLRAPSYGL